MKIKEAMKVAKETGRRVKVTEPTPITETKVNVSIRIDLEVLNWLKAEADRQSIPYTTLANALLKRASMTESVEDRLSRLERAMLGNKAV